MTITLTDKGTSTPINQSGTTTVAIAAAPNRNKIAEFGLVVDRPSSSQAGFFNFVELSGSVGVRTQSDIVETVTLIITRRNTTISGSEVVVFTAPQTVVATPSASTLITFSYTDGGVDELITAGNYSYSLYIQRNPLIINLPILSPVVIQGPITFTGTSFVRS